MYDTIFINDNEIDNNVTLAYADSYFKLGLSKLDFVKIISIEKLEDIYFKCKNLIISGNRNSIKFNNFIINNSKLNLIKNINIYLILTGGIHNYFDFTFKYNVISTYSYALNIYFDNYNDNYWMPHMLRYNVKYNNNPINKVLVTGATNIEVYPNRHIMIEKSKLNSNIVYTKRPWVEKNNIGENDLFGENYIKLLSNYLICYTDELNDNRPYLVAK